MLQEKSPEEIAKYYEEFRQTRKLQLPQLLIPAKAEQIYLFLHRLLPQYWVCATCVKRDRQEFPFNHKQIPARERAVKEAFGRGDFSFFFYRTFNATPGQYSPLEFEIRTYFSSPPFIEMLNQVTGMGLTTLNTLFVSKYTSGSFLSTHSDKGNGRLAFVLHMTKGWKPPYGGHLHFLDQAREKVIETFTPEFNTMMIFEVPEEEGIPHFVGHVAPNVPIPRIAITGWFS